MRSTVLRRGVAGAFFLCAAAFVAPDAQAFSNAAFIQPSDLTADQMFGSAVAIDGNIMAISTRGVAPNIPSAVYVFANVSGSWTQQAKLTGELDFSNNAFGASLAIQGDTLFVGDGVAPNDDGFVTGAVFVYKDDNGKWTQQAKLTPADAPNGAHFGGGFENTASGSAATRYSSARPTMMGRPAEPAPSIPSPTTAASGRSRPRSRRMTRRSRRSGRILPRKTAPWWWALPSHTHRRERRSFPLSRMDNGPTRQRWLHSIRELCFSALPSAWTATSQPSAHLS
jgi:hypothetical protein